jgi:hypothetical protein
MKKHLLGVALVMSLAYGGLPGSLGAESLNASAIPSPEVVGPRIVEGSKVTLLYVISVRDSSMAMSANLSKVNMKFAPHWNT